MHHSDRGVQYASKDYVELLTEHDILISMSRRGNPYDNAQAESFMKTLKYEEVYRNEYLDFVDALRCIGKFIESVYNEKRLHSALGYVPPAEFEQQQLLLPAEVGWAKREEKLIFDASGPKTARVFDLQSIFSTAPDVGPGEFFEA